MSVSNGQPATATIFNSAFISRVSDSTTVAQLDLLKASGSGDTITDAQLAINQAKISAVANQNISAAGSIASDTIIGHQFRRITGDGAPVTTLSTPFGAGGGWLDGMIMTLVGLSDTNTVTINNNDAAKGAVLNGNATLGRFSVLKLMYDSTEDRWIELSRNF